jgi:ClpP class serine protease
MSDTYDQFLSKAMEGRARAGKHFSRKEFIDLAEGRIWTGRQALQHGLVDALGSLDDAIADAKVMGGLARDADVDFLTLPRPPGLLETFGEGRSLLGSLARLPEVGDHARAVQALLALRGERVWVMMPHGVRLR